MNPLGSVVSTNHHQNSINCFNTASSAANVMSTTMLPGSMGSSLSGTGTTSGGPCPYTTPSNPYMYHHRTGEPVNAMSTSIASLRLKAKQHSSGFSSPYSTQSSSISPVSRSNSGGLSNCQYAGVTDASVWENALVGSLLSQTSSLSHLLNSDHELNFDQRHDNNNHHHQQQQQQQRHDVNNVVITDDEDCVTNRNGALTINNDIVD